MDRNILQELLTRWNPHFTSVNRGEWKGTVPRIQYLNRISKLMDLRHAIILSGVRRSGKSTIMQQVMGQLIEEKKVPPQNVLYLYLDDLVVAKYLNLGSDLLEEFYKYYLETYNPQGRIYVFIDEIQEVKDFNRWLHTYYEFNRTNLKFIISGSRKSLLESETATLMTGRNVLVEVYPLNFYEYLQMKDIEITGGDTVQNIYASNYHQHLSLLHHLGNFLFEGGFPEIVLSKTIEEKRAIASTYYRDIVTRDVLLPNNIRNARDIEVLGLQVLTDFTRTHTYGSLGKPSGMSIETVKNYLEYFTKAYLFFESLYFSYKTKETQDMQKPRKIYIVDNGIRNFNIPIPRPDIGQCAENIVYMELKKNSVLVSYWKGKQETDFAVQNGSLKLFNVSYTDDLHAREVKGILEGLNEFNLKTGIILTKNYMETKEVEGKIIERIPLWVWLLMSSRVFFKEHISITLNMEEQKTI